MASWPGPRAAALTCTARRPLPSRNKGAGTLGLGPLPAAPPSHAGAQPPATEHRVVYGPAWGRRAGGGQAPAVWVRGPQPCPAPPAQPELGGRNSVPVALFRIPPRRRPGTRGEREQAPLPSPEQDSRGLQQGPSPGPRPPALLAALPVPQASLALPAVLGQPSACSGPPIRPLSPRAHMDLLASPRPVPITHAGGAHQDRRRPPAPVSAPVYPEGSSRGPGTPPTPW